MESDLNLVIDVVRLASGLILASGGETYRAEETAERIAMAFGYQIDIMALPTGLTLTVSRGEENGSSIVRVGQRTIDLSKLEQVNSISRGLSLHEITLEEAASQLQEISRRKMNNGLQSICAAGGTSAMFALMFGGGLVDIAAAGLIAACVQGILLFLPDQEGMPLSCLIGGLFAATLALFTITLFGQGDVNRIIWSVMMPLLPGISFTNGIRDSMHGDMISGGARISDAVMRAVVLAAGAGIAMSVYLKMGGVMTWLN